MKNYKFSGLVLIVLVGLLILPALFSFAIKRIPDGSQPSLKNVFPIFAEQAIAQTFIAKENNLSGVGMSIKNPNLRNTKELVLTVMNEQGVEIAQVSKFGSTIPDGNFINFDFNPIKESAGKRFVVMLSAPSATEEDSLEVFLTNEPTDRLQLLVKGNEQITEEAISMVSFYQPVSFIGMPLVIYQHWFSKLFSDTLFAIFYLVMVSGLVSYLFILEKRG